MLGAALMAKSKASEAIHHFEHAIALKPNLPSAYERLHYIRRHRLKHCLLNASERLGSPQTMVEFAS
jgi:hypothetical protein